MSRGLRLPNESEIGPTTSWPSASPTTNAVSVNCSVPSSVARSPVIVGSEGRYMSIDSGPKAVSPPSSNAYLTRLGKLCCCSSVGDAALARTAVWVAMKRLPPVVVPLAATHHTVENIPLSARGDRYHTRLLPLLAGSTDRK